MDSSIAIGAGLWLLGVLCVVTLVLWSRSDRRKEREAVEVAGEEVEPPPPKPGFWDRLGVEDRPW